MTTTSLDHTEEQKLNVNFKTHTNLETAQSEAMKEAANSTGYVMPVTAFRQGKRWHLSGALPIGIAFKLLQNDPAEKKSDMEKVRLTTNRPVDPSHVKDTAKYLQDNFDGKYILPPLTINVREAINLYVADYTSPVRVGYLVLPFTARLSITDGQHRYLALGHVLASLDEERAANFRHDGIAMMMTCEQELDQVHQDFADCSKTKPLPKSLIAVYDMRNPANGLVAKLIDSCPLFKGKIDATSTTLSKRSSAVFLTNQVRTIAKEFLIGNGALSDVDFDRRASEMLADQEVFNVQLEKFTKFINLITEAQPILKEVSLLPQGPERQRIPALRGEWLILTGNAWAIIGRIGHQLFRDSVPNWEEYAKKLATQIDWKRTAEIWRGNLVQDGVVVRTNKAWNLAASKVREAIGLPAIEPIAADESEEQNVVAETLVETI